MKRARIIILDDDLMLGEQLRGLLAVLGNDATLCPDAQKGLAAMQQDPPDVVFCDYWLPPAGAQEVYREMVLRQPRLSGRFVFLTGGVLGGDTHFFLRSTGSPQLMKPFKLPAVRDILQSILEPAEHGTSS